MWNYLLNLLGYSDSETKNIDQNDHQNISQYTNESSWEVMNSLSNEEKKKDDEKIELDEIQQSNIHDPPKNKTKKNKNKYKNEEFEDYAKHINTKDYMKYHENRFMKYTFDDNYFNLGNKKNNKKNHYIQQPKKKMS